MLHSGAKVMVFDEFLSTLDRDTAKAVAYYLQKIARRERRVIRTDSSVQSSGD